MRERKKINYAAFGDNDDDDFADPSPHERKKSALANKENKDKSKKSERAVKPVKGTQRLSLEEKLFERDLQAALNLSVSESQESSDGIEALKPEDNSHQVTVTVESAPPLSSVKSSVTEPDVTSGKVDQSDTDLKPGSDHQSQHVITARKRPAEVEEDEVIQILESDILSGEQPSKRRRVTSAPKKSKYVDSDSDGSEFGMDSDSDESFSEGDDSDFDDGSKSKSKASKASSATKTKPVPAAVTKTKPVPAAVSKTKLAVTKTKPAPAAKVQKPATQLQSTTGKTTSVVRKSVSSPGGATVSPQNRPKASTKGPKTSWTPPALSSSCKSAVGGNAMTSPSAGIRLGLSRLSSPEPTTVSGLVSPFIPL
ncbi:RAD51-associated protein 1-like isoform X2 [Haliotis rubra]|uniref:RAD51-associated protein 1-like isoform X2 n=1 Tax=Haliotis rubra TaxID=36100 RepID=UPI001EE5F34B|nr:RAD51-associated protein 1-like isoform X2 [Haliotis rubra]